MYGLKLALLNEIPPIIEAYLIAFAVALGDKFGIEVAVFHGTVVLENGLFVELSSP